VSKQATPELNVSEDLEIYTRATPTIESEHPELVAFARTHARGAQGEIETAVRLYYAVRDGIRYNPYGAAISVEGLRATVTLAAGKGWCVSKSVLLAACCRALGVPARLGFADVRNHLATANMRAAMATQVFYWHGYTSLHLDGRWVKATPAFNIELCEKFGFLPLEFDGRNDSLFHPFDSEGKQHMEYLVERGEFADVPLDAMLATFRAKYASLMGDGGRSFVERDFDAEVEAEVAESASS
jgi:transglutaminase-like putative cysteine protease